MPQPRVLDFTQSEQRDPSGVEELFSSIGKSYKDEADRNQIGEILKEYSQNQEDAKSYGQARQRLETRSLSPSKRLEGINALNDIEKSIVQRDKALNKQITQKKDAYETELQKKGAAEVTELEKKIPAYNNTLSDIDEMERLSKEYLGGVKGYIKGGFGTQSARELETLGASALDPIIKKFNPAGTLPTAKLNWIRQTFSPTAAENPSGRQGKINNLRRFTKQAKKKDEERLSLLKEYRGLIPPEVVQKFEAAEYAENEALADELSFEDKIRDLKPDDLVEGMYDQKGEKLGPIPKKEAVKLFEQGLITNVPN
jgi:hypothetical protein